MRSESVTPLFVHFHPVSPCVLRRVKKIAVKLGQVSPQSRSRRPGSRVVR
jgi:hypothetical protein